MAAPLTNTPDIQQQSPQSPQIDLHAPILSPQARKAWIRDRTVYDDDKHQYESDEQNQYDRRVKRVPKQHATRPTSQAQATDVLAHMSTSERAIGNANHLNESHLRQLEAVLGKMEEDLKDSEWVRIEDSKRQNNLNQDARSLQSHSDSNGDTDVIFENEVEEAAEALGQALATQQPAILNQLQSSVRLAWGTLSKKWKKSG